MGKKRSKDFVSGPKEGPFQGDRARDGRSEAQIKKSKEKRKRGKKRNEKGSGENEVARKLVNRARSRWSKGDDSASPESCQKSKAVSRQIKSSPWGTYWTTSVLGKLHWNQISSANLVLSWATSPTTAALWERCYSTEGISCRYKRSRCDVGLTGNTETLWFLWDDHIGRSKCVKLSITVHFCRNRKAWSNSRWTVAKAVFCQEKWYWSIVRKNA